MEKSQIKQAASRLVDFAGQAGGADLVREIAGNGYTAEIDWVSLVGYVPSEDDQAAVRERCRGFAAAALSDEVQS